MRTIAIETSGRQGSVAALHFGAAGVDRVHQTMFGTDQRTAQAMAPALRDLLTEIDWPPSSIDLVAVAIGPGSFTGLRIGVTTAKAFAYAVGAQIIGVETLDVIAAQAMEFHGQLWVIMDAQRQELFAAAFEGSGNADPQRLSSTSVIGQENWLAGLQPGDRVSGPALRHLASRLPPKVIAVPENLWQPTAAAVGHVAWQAYRAGRRDDIWKLAPNYYRPSAAEEKLA